MKEAAYYGRPRLEMRPFVPTAARRLLDVGCGAGTFAAGLKVERPGLEVWGLEADPQAAARARGVLDHVLAGDAAALLPALAGERFDAIVLNDILEHVVAPEALLVGLRPLLAPRGRVIASIPNVRHFVTVADLVFRGRWEYTDEGTLDRTHLRFFTRASLPGLFGAAGFELETVAGINVTGSLKFKLFNALTLGRFADMGCLQFACVARSATDPETP
jgi:2-polyprenyl-3-methyl-5-hydroxy-6-metoxy-1,4-benzoquinol methylase